ncbi:hypothetical protein T01_9100 [Trichinella spiralis]|uniref:Uncharacterized protein n=1 Tax=Trichinella spiralis TaxID=6334 RepID=A0A0V1AI13_TRISP|nr:hypothetical protein T01_9100 [Trichinella spiralis]
MASYSLKSRHSVKKQQNIASVNFDLLSSPEKQMNQEVEIFLKFVLILFIFFV